MQVSTVLHKGDGREGKLKDLYRRLKLGLDGVGRVEDGVRKVRCAVCLEVDVVENHSILKWSELKLEGRAERLVLNGYHVCKRCSDAKETKEIKEAITSNQEGSK